MAGCGKENIGQSGKIGTFQGLRCFACLSVFLQHAFTYVDVPYPYTGAYFGVALFLCLSGFLAQRKRETSGEERGNLFGQCCRSFLHTAKRIYPLHWIMLLAVAVPTALETGDRAWVFAGKFLLNACLLQSWVPTSAFAYSFNNVSWFLCTTMLFAFLRPLIVNSVEALGRKSCLFFLGAVLAIEAAAGVLPAFGARFRFAVYVFPPFRLADCFAGCLLYRVGVWFRGKCGTAAADLLLVCSALAAAALVAVLNTVRLSYFAGFFRAAVWCLPAWAMILSLFCEEKLSRPLRFVFSNRVCVFLGGISFEFFLLHNVVLRYGKRGYEVFLHRAPDWSMLLIGFLVALGLSAALRCLGGYFEKRAREKKLSKRSSDEKSGRE